MQIGGLLLATLVTEGVVPLPYALLVETLRVVDGRSDPEHHATHGDADVGEAAE